MKTPRNIYLIDGNSYVYRAYHAIKDLTNSRGFPTNAVYGFTNMIMKLLKEKRPDAVVVAFDSPAPTERHLVYEEYKAQRPEMPGDLVMQIPYIRKVVNALRLKTYEIAGQEADDILATLALRASSEGIDVFIVTGDKDMLQVLSDNVRIYDPMKDRVYSREYVLKRFGLPPERIPELMALTGDPTDNIPGVRGIGEKTACEILKDTSLMDILDNPEVVKKERLRRMIAGNLNDVRLSLSLATVEKEVPLEFDPRECVLREPDYDELLRLFRELEFGSLLRMIPAKGVSTGCRVVTRQEELGGLLNGIKDRVFIKTVSDTGDADGPGVTGVALLYDHSPLYVPVQHRYIGAGDQLGGDVLLSSLVPVLTDSGVSKIGHDLKRDLRKFLFNGIAVSGELRDAMIASYLLNPNKQIHSLEEMSLEYLSLRKEGLKEFLGRRRTLSECTIEETSEFFCGELMLIEDMEKLLFRRLSEEGLRELYFELEMPLIRVLAEMETTGVKVDAVRLKEISRELESDLSELRRSIYGLAGEEFNINSPKQLSRILFEKLGLPHRKKTKTGYSTDMGVLEELAGEHELPREILNWRSLNKLKTTYVDVLPGLINPVTGRIHTTFNQAVTATGRLSSSVPNLQNIPVRGRWGRRIRETFVAEEGFSLLSADYSQIELRILAHLSGDERLMEAFRMGMDVHTSTAMEIYGVPEKGVTSDMRRVAKTVNFGVVYGISSFGLSGAVGSSHEDAGRYIEQYFEKYRGVREYFDRIIDEAKKLGYVRTLFGRKREIPELGNPNKQKQALGERLAMNTPIQGSAADIIKRAMIGISGRLKEGSVESRMILQVHDELLFEVKVDELEVVREIVREGMEAAAELSVPLRVDIGVADNWADAHG